MATDLRPMSPKSPSSMLLTPVYFFNSISPVYRAFFLAEAIHDGIIDLLGTLMYALEHHTLAIYHMLTSHSLLSLTLTYSDDEDMHAAPPNTFHLFPQLPTELRQLIWSFALEPPSGRLFHIEALRRADFGRTEAQWAFYQRRGRPGGMTMAMCPTQRIAYIAASCREACDVVRRHSPQQREVRTRIQDPQGTPAAAAVASEDDRIVRATVDSFRPDSDFLYMDALCLGCIPSPQVARNRIQILATPRQGREVETIALEAGSLWSAAIGTNNTSVKPAVRREVFKAICQEFAGVKKLVLLGSRQCEKRGRAGIWTRLWGGASRRESVQRIGQGPCEDETGGVAGKCASATQTALLGFRKDALSDSYSGMMSGAGMHLAFHPAVHGFANLLQWAFGDDRYASGNRRTQTPCREPRSRRNRRFVQQTATEKECCKKLPVCLLDTDDFDELPEHMLSDRGVNDDIESGNGMDEVEAVQAILGQLLDDGEITQVPLVERKILVRSAGCTGPWSYRTGMARESCSNDDWYWQRRKMEQPVWRLREDCRKLEFS